MCQAVSTSAVVRGSTNTSGRWPNSSQSRAKLRFRAREVVGQLLELDDAERGGELRRLEVPADLVEDEQVVVLEVAVDRREEPPLDALAGAEDLHLRAPAPAAQQQAAVDELVVVEADHAAGARRGDDVREGERRDRDVAAGAGRRAPQRRARARRRSPRSPAARGRRRSSRMRSQSGTLPMRFGHQDRLGARADHRLDRVDVDVVGVGLDVDEHRHEPGPDDRRDVGGERHRRGDDLVAGLRDRAARPRGRAPTSRSCTSRRAACRTARRRRARRPARSCRCAAPAVRRAAPTSTASISRSSWTLPA